MRRPSFNTTLKLQPARNCPIISESDALPAGGPRFTSAKCNAAVAAKIDTSALSVTATWSGRLAPTFILPERTRAATRSISIPTKAPVRRLRHSRKRSARSVALAGEAGRSDSRQNPTSRSPRRRRASRRDCGSSNGAAVPRPASGSGSSASALAAAFSPRTATLSARVLAQVRRGTSGIFCDAPRRHAPARSHLRTGARVGSHVRLRARSMETGDRGLEGARRAGIPQCLRGRRLGRLRLRNAASHGTSPIRTTPVPFDQRLQAAKKAFDGRPRLAAYSSDPFRTGHAKFWKIVADEAAKTRPDVKVVSYVYDNYRKPPGKAVLSQKRPVRRGAPGIDFWLQPGRFAGFSPRLGRVGEDGMRPVPAAYLHASGAEFPHVLRPNARRRPEVCRRPTGCAAPDFDRSPANTPPRGRRSTCSRQSSTTPTRR